MAQVCKTTATFLYLILVFCCTFVNSILITHQKHDRERRELPMYFLNSGLLSIIFGIGMPVEDLQYESVTSGLIVRAQYFLPNNPTDMHHRETINVHGRAETRWHVYKNLENVIEKFVSNGNICILRSICEVAAVPLNDVNGVLTDIIHIILTPSATLDIRSHNNSNEYLRAEQLGRNGDIKACVLYHGCPLSIIDLFTRKFDES